MNLPCLSTVARVVGLFAVPAVLCAESSVWKITRGDQTLYLGGTIHALRATDFPLPPEFDQAFAASSAVVFETDLARIQSPEMQQVVMQHGIYQDGTILETVLSPEAWSRVRTYGEKAGLPLAQITRFKPWFFTMTVFALEMQKIGVMPGGVDLHYFQQASATGKSVGQLETFEEQVAFMIGLGAGQESEMVSKAIDDIAEMPEQFGDMIDAWRSGDVSRIDALILESVRTEHPAIFRELFVARNTAWIPRIEALLASPGVEFVLVGAGHVAGPEGLLARLEGLGCRVEALRVVAPAAPAAAGR